MLRVQVRPDFGAKHHFGVLIKPNFSTREALKVPNSIPTLLQVHRLPFFYIFFIFLRSAIDPCGSFVKGAQ